MGKYSELLQTPITQTENVIEIPSLLHKYTLSVDCSLALKIHKCLMRLYAAPCKTVFNGMPIIRYYAN